KLIARGFTPDELFKLGYRSFEKMHRRRKPLPRWSILMITVVFFNPKLGQSIGPKRTNKNS
ncbi:MAG: hypothetical protein OTI34_16545, partial [Lewinella sp.]|nr:hypothetical protein [Lewinella sp.]